MVVVVVVGRSGGVPESCLLPPYRGSLRVQEGGGDQGCWWGEGLRGWANGVWANVT